METNIKAYDKFWELYQSNNSFRECISKNLQN